MMSTLQTMRDAVTRRPGRERVSVTRLTHANAREALGAALDAIPAARSSAARLIAVKINICDYRRAESGAVTDPVILGALLDALRERHPAARLAIVENDATTLDIAVAYKLLGFDRVAADHGAELHNVATGAWTKKPVPGGLLVKELEVPAILDECDLFVNFAKLKTNALTKTTGCLKNIFAFYRAKRKVILHGQIDEILHDMNKVIKPDVCLVDGHVGMEGMGPAFGRPKRCDLLISGANPVAVDACEARVMGFRPLSVRHVRMCHEAGLGPVDYQLDTDIAGFDYADYRFDFPHLEYYLRNALRSRAGIAT
jgi:uncharacterized protein (DUF362 family)